MTLVGPSVLIGLKHRWEEKHGATYPLPARAQMIDAWIEAKRRIGINMSTPGRAAQKAYPVALGILYRKARRTMRCETCRHWDMIQLTRYEDNPDGYCAVGIPITCALYVCKQWEAKP